MSQEKFKIVGKPVHKNKHQAIFELFDEYLENPERCESLDWIILSKDGPTINFKNKHTLEKFVCVIRQF
jgi:hypothetical protein